MREIIKIIIPGTPVPKPRMTRRDRWKPRQCVTRYWAWKDAVGYSYRQQAKGRFFRKCALGFHFYIPGNPHADTDNYIKGVKDALKNVAFSDDNIRIIPMYDHVYTTQLCEFCQKHPCGKVRQCKQGKAEITIREIGGANK